MDTLEVAEEEPEEDKFIDIIDGVVVVVESFADAKTIAPQVFVSTRQAESAAEQSFVSAFRKQFRRDPRYAAAGYDATRLLIEGWGQGHRDPAALIEWLGAVRFYEGGLRARFPCRQRCAPTAR